jgi:hypothetical protein
MSDTEAGKQIPLLCLLLSFLLCVMESVSSLTPATSASHAQHTTQTTDTGQQDKPPLEAAAPDPCRHAEMGSYDASFCQAPYLYWQCLHQGDHLITADDAASSGADWAHYHAPLSCLSLPSNATQRMESQPGLLAQTRAPLLAISGLKTLVMAAPMPRSSSQ